MACPLAAEHIWVEKPRYHDAEREYYERLAKLLKESVSIPVTEEIPPTQNLEKPKKKSRKNTAKSQSPEAISERVEVTSQKPNPNNTPGKGKKPKKNQKTAESESSSTNSAPNEVPHKIQEVNVEAVEEAKSKKKRKKKANKDAAEKLQDLCQKENIPPILPTAEIKVDTQDSNKKSKNLKNKGSSSNQCTLVSEIAKARQHIKNSLEKMDGIATLAATPASPDVLDRLAAIEKENADLRKLVDGLKTLCIQSENRVKALEEKLAGVSITANSKENTLPEKKVDDDDGVDLFASDSEEDDTEAAKIREERLAAYAAKKSKKPALIAKSSLVLDVKPWDDETDMKAMEAEVRKITMDGLLWGASKNVPVAFGIQKLSITCVVEDEKVSIDLLTEEIEKLEDFVQSVDVAAFNKI